MSEDSRNLPVPTSPSNATPARNQRPLWVAITLLLLALIALALFNAYQWQQREALAQRIEGRVAGLSQTVDNLGSQRQSVDSQITDRLRRLESNQDQLESGQEEQNSRQQQMQRRIDQAAQSLLQMGNRTRNDWLLAEAEYLMSIANQRLRMERDIGGAIALLQNADDVLKEADDMGAYPIREELAREIQALKAIEEIDRVGLYLKLEAAIEQVSSLSIENLDTITPLDITAVRNVDLDLGGDNVLLKAWQAIKQTLAEVVVVRRLDEPVKPLLSPRQSAYANLNLRLMLEEAEMALLSAEPVVYEHALSKAQEWLVQWYDESNPQVAALKQTLENLAQRKIKPELPDISDSLNLLKARINGRLSGGSSTEGAPSSTSQPAKVGQDTQESTTGQGPKAEPAAQPGAEQGSQSGTEQGGQPEPEQTDQPGTKQGGQPEPEPTGQPGPEQGGQPQTEQDVQPQTSEGSQSAS